jgi:glycosyltransferase involved in cell wall biosynthesis
MIVRDEEEYLASCLESALPAVDEIVVVDTGSKDQTVRIAQKFHARVYHFPWRDDFSAARNVSLDQARGDWCLVLDADEYLDPAAPAIIKSAVEQNRHSGFFLSVVSLYEGSRQADCCLARLFVNHPDIRYRYLIHEQMLPDLSRYARRNNKPLGILRAKIIHKGYHPRVVQNREKIDRNRRLFLKQLDLYPRDVYSWYKYADFLSIYGGTPEELLYALKRAFGLLRETSDTQVKSYPFAGEVAALLGLQLDKKEKDPNGALAVLGEGVERFLATPHLFYVKAGLERKQGLYGEALKSYQRCLDLNGSDFMVPVTRGITRWLALNGMGFCHLDEGRLKEARRCFLLSLRAQPDQIEPYVGLSEIAYSVKDLEGALKWMKKLLRFSEILARLELHDQAEEWRLRARRNLQPL